jgi:hypothetical protein
VVQRIDKTSLFDESLRTLEEHGAKKRTFLLRALCKAASRSGAGSYEYSHLREALPNIALDADQLMDPVADTYPNYSQVALADWFEASLLALRRRSPGDHREMLAAVFRYAKSRGTNSPENDELYRALSELSLSRSELLRLVSDVYPEYANGALAELDITVILYTQGDRLLQDDLEKALLGISPAFKVVSRDEPAEIILRVARLQWDEHGPSERTQTVSYSQSQVNAWNAVLNMPDYSSYKYEHTVGEVSIEYAFELQISIEDGVVLDELVRDRLAHGYSFCSNARVENAFGGSQQAGFIANDHMQSLCAQGSSPVHVSALRDRVFSELAMEISSVPYVKEELDRYRR